MSPMGRVSRLSLDRLEELPGPSFRALLTRVLTGRIDSELGEWGAITAPRSSVRAEYRKPLWSYDFVEHRTCDVREYSMLNIVDEVPRTAEQQPRTDHGADADAELTVEYVRHPVPGGSVRAVIGR